MIETLPSPSAAERLRAAEAFVTRYPADAEVLIIGASRDAADDLARRVTATRGATFGLHRASFLQLAVFAVSLVLMAGLHVVIFHTRLGRAMRVAVFCYPRAP